MALRLPVFIAFVCAFALTAAGQQVITLNPVNIMGDIVQITPRSVVVKAGDNSNWTLNLGNTTRIKVTGTAVPEMITPRVCVRFVASIDKHTCKAQDKLDKVTIFTPSPGIASRTLGVELAKNGSRDDEGGLGGLPPMGGPPGLPPNGRGPGPRSGRGPGGQPPGTDQGALPRQGPLPGPDAGADDEGAKGPKRRTAGKGPAADVADVASYEVCAQVVSYRGHRLTVNVQNRFFKPRITAELSTDAEIGLDISDLSVVKPGDKISASGYYVTPGVCMQTNKLIVTLANPLGAKGGHARRVRPEANAEAVAGAAHHPVAKPGPSPKTPAGAAAAEDNQFGGDPFPATDEKKPPVANDVPKEKDDDPAADDAKPNSDSPVPDTKKPDEPPHKKPPAKDDEKDVFDK